MVLSRAEFIARQPKKRMAANALIRDGDGRLLLVKPTYRPEWLVPGGVIEADESPYAACRREVREEIGLDLDIGRLLCVEYQTAGAERSEALVFSFDGGVLTPDHIAALVLQESELCDYQFLALGAARPLFPERLAGQMTASFSALVSGATAYLEDGRLLGR